MPDPALVERWLAAYRASPLRVPGPPPSELAGLAATVMEALPDGGLPGGTKLRETEKRWAFAGGALAAAGASAFDVMAFVMSLRDLVDGSRSLYDWFAALALEGWATSRIDAVKVRQRDSLEKGTPVLLLGRGVPAALLIGEPDRLAVETTLSRLLLLVARVGARVALVDATGLSRPADRGVVEGVAAFAANRRLPKLAVVLTGLPEAAAGPWREAFPRTVRVLVEDALAEGVARAEGVA